MSCLKLSSAKPAICKERIFKIDTKKLTEEFQKFVGKEMKDPKRMTRDLCPVENDIQELAHKSGLHLVFTDIADRNRDPFMADVVAAHVAIQKNEKSGLYKILNVNVG